MPNKSNRYRGPKERSERDRKAAQVSSGRFGPIGRFIIAAWLRVHRPHPRREVVIVGSFTLAVVVGIGGIGGAYLLYRSNHDWTGVASVNGTSISRQDLRSRMAVLSLLAQERGSFISGAVAGGGLPAAQASALQNAAAADTTMEAARESLIDDELLRQVAARDGVATLTSPDPWAEATAYASGDLTHRVRYVRFGLPAAGSPVGPAPGGSTAASPWPTASAANLAATTSLVRSGLAAKTPVETIVADLHDAGWTVLGEDVDVSADGVPADASLDLDPTIAADAVGGAPGKIIGPTTDAYGRVSLGLLLGPVDDTLTSRRIPIDADKAGLDLGAIQSWANGRALRGAVTAHLLAGWSKGVPLAHFRELVIGPAPDSSASAGPWVELSALVVGRLSGVGPSSISGAPANLNLDADSLSKTLAGLSPTDRSTLFRALVAAANKVPGQGSTNASGELGFYTKDSLVPDLGKAALADKTHTGDVIGPVSTAAGPEIFLVESRYGGTLDDRSQAALRQIRGDPAANPITYTEKLSPADAPLALDAGWRAEPEFGTTEAVRGALFDTPIGTLSDPFVLDGKLALAVVTERRNAVPDARTLDRLSLDGYDAWFASEYTKATITRSDNPLPELMPSASPTSPASAASALPSAPALETPNLPANPGQPVSTPVPTDAMGLPALP